MKGGVRVRIAVLRSDRAGPARKAAPLHAFRALISRSQQMENASVLQEANGYLSAFKISRLNPNATSALAPQRA